MTIKKPSPNRPNIEKIFRERLQVQEWLDQKLKYTVRENNCDNIARFLRKKDAEAFVEGMIKNDTDLFYKVDTFPNYDDILIFKAIKGKYKIWSPKRVKGSMKYIYKLYNKERVIADFKRKDLAELAIKQLAIKEYEFDNLNPK